MMLLCSAELSVRSFFRTMSNVSGCNWKMITSFPAELFRPELASASRSDLMGFARALPILRATARTTAARKGREGAHHTGSAIEYFTWLNAKLDSIEAMPSSRVSLVFRNVSYDDRSAATTRNR
jgi:hypothetical protein